MGSASKPLTRPALHTARLILLPLRARHAAEMHAAIEESRRSLGRWLTFATMQTAEQTQAFIRRGMRSEHDIVWGIWLREAGGTRAGRERTTPARAGEPHGAYCGNVGLHRIVIEQAIGTIGYWNRRSLEGKGIITEAVAAVLLWASGPFGLERIAVEAATGNKASLRVIEKLGFTREGVLREAQRIPGRLGRLDWVISSIVRADLPRVRPALTRICGTARPWEIERRA